MSMKHFTQRGSFEEPYYTKSATNVETGAQSAKVLRALNREEIEDFSSLRVPEIEQPLIDPQMPLTRQSPGRRKSKNPDVRKNMYTIDKTSEGDGDGDNSNTNSTSARNEFGLFKLQKLPSG